MTMKSWLISGCMFAACIVLAQEPTQGEVALCYELGKKTLEHIQQQDENALQREFKQDKNLPTLLTALKSEKAKSGEYEIHWDVYYHADRKHCVFFIYAAKHIETESDWGLNDYLYIIEIDIQNKPSPNAPEIIQKRIVSSDTSRKKWWQSLMNSYNDPRYLREKWFKISKIPPPPPPATPNHRMVQRIMHHSQQLNHSKPHTTNVGKPHSAI